MSPIDAAALAEARQAVLPRVGQAEVGVVLGSGLGAFGETLDDSVRLPYAQIPHLPRPAVAGHAGELCCGRIGAVRVACLSGRVHLYEGHAPAQVVFGVRLLAELGCRAVLLTNAAGGISAGLAPGDLLVLTDHLNLMGLNPLVGPHDGLGPRFPDLTQAYDRELVEVAEQVAAAAGIQLARGVYAAMLGPSYETPAEIRMLRLLGADAVGMSTVPEVIALRQRGIRVGAMSCITNLAAGIAGATLDHAEVELTARSAKDRFAAVLGRWVEATGSLLAMP